MNTHWLAFMVNKSTDRYTTPCGVDLDISTKLLQRVWRCHFSIITDKLLLSESLVKNDLYSDWIQL